MSPIFLKGPVATVFLTDPRKRTAVTLYASADAEIEVFWGHKGRDHLLEEHQLVRAEYVQSFYESLLGHLGYELPHVPARRRPARGPLSLRRDTGTSRTRTEFTLSCRVGDGYIGVNADGLIPRTINVTFGPKRALELCRALAAPLGWELTE